MIVGGAGDIARAARARTGAVDGFVHGIQNYRVLALTQIVIGAPDGDFAFLAFRIGPERLGEPAADALQIRKNPVTAFTPDRSKGILKVGFIGKSHGLAFPNRVAPY